MQCMVLDVACQRLAIARDRLVLPLARVARAMSKRSVWQVFGYARASDFTRERLNRSSRWLRDLAALDDALRTLPALSGALCGDDGRPAIGRVAAALIGCIATPESVIAWIDFARSNTVRGLAAEVRRARTSRSVWPKPEGELPAQDGSTPVDRGKGTGSGGAAQADSHGKPASPDANSMSDAGGGESEEQDQLRASVTVALPRPLFTAFQETLELHRAVEGRESLVAEFVDALSAETSNSSTPPDGVAVQPLLQGPKLRDDEERLARATRHWSHLHTLSSEPDKDGVGHESSVADIRAHAVPIRDALEMVDHIEELTARAGHGDPAELMSQMEALIALEEQIEIQLGELLASIGQDHGWRQLRFKGVGHYGTERLGLSRTTAENRAGLARMLREHPRVRRAYEEGRFGLEAALLVCRVLSRSRATARLEMAWVERAAQVTIKRLRDEIRTAIRSQMLGVQSKRLDSFEEPARLDLSAVSLCAGHTTATDLSARGAVELGDREWRFPSDDRTWHDSLQRAPGDGRRRVVKLGIMALENPIPDVFLRLRLPDNVAGLFLGTLEAKRGELTAQAEHDTWESDWEEAPWEAVVHEGALGFARTNDDSPGVWLPSWLAARMFVSRGRRIPTWVALLAMLEDYVYTWDDPAGMPSRTAGSPYIRDGWRCAAPGCTSRQNLESHHIVYRSRGGGNELANRTCICRFHHQRGEHGGLASCRGRAPLDIVWRLGRGDLARWYRNERLLAPVQWPAIREASQAARSVAVE